MKKYMIDYENGSGSGCDQMFNTREEAEAHMRLWTAEEREGCEIVEVEVEGKFKSLQDVADAYNEADNMVELERDIIASGFDSDMDTEWGVAHNEHGRVIVNDGGVAVVVTADEEKELNEVHNPRYLVTMEVGDEEAGDVPSRYVWTGEDVENGGWVSCPNGLEDAFEREDEAWLLVHELKEYAAERGYTNVKLSVEEVWDD